MTCLAIAIGILGIAAMRRAHRRYHGYGCGWYGPGFGYNGHHGHHHHGWHGHHGRHGRARMMLYAAFSRIDASPAQERAIVTEVDRLQERLHAAKSGMRDARGDLAAAMRGPVLDDAALGAVLGRVDTATGEARTAVLEALRGIHGVLDDRQRNQIADFLDRGGGWWRGFGPYR